MEGRCATDFGWNDRIVLVVRHLLEKNVVEYHGYMNDTANLRQMFQLMTDEVVDIGIEQRCRSLER